MGQRISIFLVVLQLMFLGRPAAQKLLPLPDAKSVLSIHSQGLHYRPALAIPAWLKPRNDAAVSPGFRLSNLPGPSYYPNSLGFICRAELKLDKITPVPVRFRLGSLEYVNWMEGKPNATRSR